MEDKIPMSSVDIDARDIRAVTGVIRSGNLSFGKKNAEFESAMADYLGVKYAVAVSSGTAALHLIVKSLGIGKGMSVLVPSFTFVASVNALLYEGATPIFVDIDPRTMTLDPVDCLRKITPQTKAIMVVDTFGQPAHWDEIYSLAKKQGLKIIDDSCEALGAQYHGKKLGQLGDAAAFAFYPNKQMTTGEGGMVTTNNAELAALVRSYRNQGRDAMGQWLVHPRMGYNYRMDEMSAALGVSQLHKLDEMLAKRERVAQMYHEKLGKYDWLETPSIPSHIKMSWFVYVITLAEDLSREAVMEGLQKIGIPSRAYFSPVHQQAYIRSLPGMANLKLPVTDSLAKRTLALPFHTGMKKTQVHQVVSALVRVVEKLRNESRRKRAA